MQAGLRIRNLEMIRGRRPDEVGADTVQRAEHAVGGNKFRGWIRGPVEVQGSHAGKIQKKGALSRLNRQPFFPGRKAVLLEDFATVERVVDDDRAIFPVVFTGLPVEKIDSGPAGATGVRPVRGAIVLRKDVYHKSDMVFRLREDRRQAVSTANGPNSVAVGADQITFSNLGDKFLLWEFAY